MRQQVTSFHQPKAKNVTSEEKGHPCLPSRQEAATVSLLFASKLAGSGIFLLRPGSQPDLVTVEDERAGVEARTLRSGHREGDTVANHWGL